MNPLAWTLLGFAVTILLGVFKLLYDLRGEVSAQRSDLASLAKVVEVASLPSMKKDVDRLVYRQELQDGRAANDAHSPHTPIVDAAIEAVMRGGLTEDELRDAICALTESMKSERNGTKWMNMGLLKDRAQADLKDLLDERAKREKALGGGHA